MMTTLALQIVTKGPSFLDQLRSNFNNQDERQAAAVPNRHRPQQQQITHHYREEREVEVRDGREMTDVQLKREDDPLLEDCVNRKGSFAHGSGDVDDGILPDVPLSSSRREKNVDEDADAFRVPEVPSHLAVAGEKKERAASKTRKRSGKSPGRTTSATRKNPGRRSDESEKKTSTHSEASDFDDFEIDGTEEKTKKRDANANHVKSRGRKPGGTEIARPGTKIPKPNDASSSKSYSHRLDDDDYNYEDDLMLLSSDDDEVRAASVTSRKAKISSSGVPKQRKQAKKKTAGTVVNDESNEMDR